MVNRVLALGFAFGLLVSCKTGTKDPEPFDWQGHRGARGELPENSLEAMQRGLQKGVKTLEMDVVLSQDSVVLLSHEPWFNPEICLDFEGKEWSDTADRNIFHYNYKQVANCDCGSKPNVRFPNQERLKTFKPRLLSVISAAEELALMMNRASPVYSVEIKSKPEWDSIYYPSVDLYCDIVLKTIAKANLGERLIIQSFDSRALRYIHEKYPQIRLAYLTETGDPSAAKQIESLGFVPEIYSCEASLLSKRLVNDLQSLELKVIPWTVNDIEEAKKLQEWGVDGIITDYPSRMLSTLGS
jgi:glycerophosphoryl diester phosphodiesterase